MLGILSTIFGSKEVISKGLELIDESFTSAEEVAENKVKLIEAKTQAKVDLLNAYKPFKIAQRYIALSFTFIFVFIMLNGVLGAMYGVIDIASVEKAKDFANSMWLGEIMITIIGFYFGGGFLESRNAGKQK